MNWCCPFCFHNSAVKESDRHVTQTIFQPGDGQLYAVVSVATYCRNSECKRFTLDVELQSGVWNTTAQVQAKHLVKHWKLIPQSSARPLPDFVPQAIRDDYNEARLIRDLSPKASATLARRCLQGMIRDFWGIKKHRLKDEIDALEEKVDADTWRAIDAVRSIGNIGAHMEKDINVIVDVEPEEAGLLIELIETLVDEWYVARHERQLRMAKVAQLAAQKEIERSGLPT